MATAVKFTALPLKETAPAALSTIAGPAAAALSKSGGKVAVFESTTAGLISAALQSIPGASSYTTFNAVTYSRRQTLAALPGLSLDFPRPEDSASYKASKKTWTASVAQQMRKLLPDATWCISESGACGPTFNYDGISAGFTAICITGPVTRGIFIESTHADRERNMYGFSKAALDLLSECINESEKSDTATTDTVAVAAPEAFDMRDDRYGGVTATAVPGLSPFAFGKALRTQIEKWRSAQKRGLWLQIPSDCAAYIPAAMDLGFAMHHAQPDYLQLTMWLPPTPSPLPLYAFTQVGVGGVVVNQKGEVLMVQERVSPSPQYQNSWKLPGGLADPSESFAETAAREVREETGVTGELVGVVSMRHSHKFRFNQSDLYVLVRLRATQEKITLVDNELQAAEWMSPERIEKLVEPDHTKPYAGKVSATNWKMINNALTGKLIIGTEMPSSRGPTMLYVA